jgi:surface protein
MSNMFTNATLFNQNIGAWNVGNVDNMSGMFSSAIAFNQDISNWTTTNVSTMTEMFSNAWVFNQPIGAWDVSNVDNMGGMFSSAYAFNQDIGDWIVTNVTNMSYMFSNAGVFNQDLSGWTISNVIDFTEMFSTSGIETANINNIFTSWGAQTVASGLILGCVGLVYSSNGAAGYNALTSAPKNWSITGISYVVTNPNATVPFSLVVKEDNTNLTENDVYQLYYNETPISSQETYTNSDITFSNVVIDTVGYITLALYNVTNPSVFPVQNVDLTVSAVCFKEGTYILTRGGYRKVDELNTGDRIKTVKNGYLPIYKIGRGRICHEKVSNRPKDCLYRYSKEQYPELIEDLVLTGGHSILVDAFASKEEEEENREVFGGDVSKIDDHRRLLSCVNQKCVVYESPGTYFIYHIALENTDEERSYGIYANGLLVESCPINYIDRM